MKKRRSFFKVMVMLAMTLLVVWTSVSYVYADFGCHMSYKISIDNYPAGYSCAIISNNGYKDATLPHDHWDGRGIQNSELHLDQVNKETVEEYLRNFYYDGWCYYQDTMSYGVTKMWTFGAHEDPFPAKILFISPEGEVTMSESIVDHKDYVYDFKKGKWINTDMAGIFGSLIGYLVICYIITLILEYSVFGFFEFSKVPQNRKKFFIVNTATNIPMNLILYSVYAAYAGWNTWFRVFIILEWIILLIESIYYSRSFVDKKGQKRPKSAFICGALANLCSAIVGLAYSMSDLHF